MMLKCLRALPLALAAEHRFNDDILQATPGEMLSIPLQQCAEQNNPRCRCRRIFVGYASGNPTTLARVCLVDSLTILRECTPTGNPTAQPPDGPPAFPTGNSPVLLHDPQAIAYAIRHFEVGAIVRVNRSDQAVFLEDTWRAAVEREEQEIPG